MSTRRFWVYIEQQEGAAHPVSWELLGVAQDLAEQVKDEAAANGDTVIVECVLLGNNVQDIAKQAIGYGADTVYMVDDEVLSYYRNCTYYQCITSIAKKYAPEVFLMGATMLGRDLAGAVATALGTGLTADCTQLNMGEVKGANRLLLQATRPAFGGNIMATIVCRTHTPQMSSVRPRVFDAREFDGSRTGNIIHEDFDMTEDDASNMACVLEFIHDKAESIDIEYADVIVSGGRGLGGPEGFKLLEELAEALGGVVGASRPCVDAGWISYEHQVGQSGKTVRPKFYVAAGISGALQHKVGMQNSDFILAINSDPKAPIFQVATVGIVGDLFEVIPAMIKEIKARKEAAA